MTVLYLYGVQEYGQEGPEIPHDVIYGILNEMELRDDRRSERKIS